MSHIPILNPLRNKFNHIFKKIGEEPGLIKILTQFYQLQSQDVLIGFFFAGKDLEKIAHTQASFLMRAWGISKNYSGKGPAQAHSELPKILKGHFDRRLELLKQTLADANLSHDEINTWVSFENKFRTVVQS